MKKRTIRYMILLIVLIILGGMYRMYLVKGWSDMPNILEKDKVIINKATYDFPVPYTFKKLFKIRDPQRNDIVLFQPPDSINRTLVVKRIVGIPGDLIEIRNHKLLINGNQLLYQYQFNQDYNHIPKEILLGKIIAIEKGSRYERFIAVKEKDTNNASFGPLLVPEDQYFILSDNRSGSIDSRFYGAVPRKNIHGKVIKVFSKKKPL